MTIVDATTICGVRTTRVAQTADKYIRTGITCISAGGRNSDISVVYTILAQAGTIGSNNSSDIKRVSNRTLNLNIAIVYASNHIILSLTAHSSDMSSTSTIKSLDCYISVVCTIGQWTISTLHHNFLVGCLVVLANMICINTGRCHIA
ncbi:MAG: hypothetical protein E7141_07140 [Rikenellaceae bacterium]|nr:hypothetical protein [Rikenellaceae bacterium]